MGSVSTTAQTPKFPFNVSRVSWPPGGKFSSMDNTMLLFITKQSEPAWQTAAVTEGVGVTARVAAIAPAPENIKLRIASFLFHKLLVPPGTFNSHIAKEPALAMSLFTPS